ncbi:putative transposase [Paraburkholderia silvatlantica]|uniref:Integrase-like protein n=1 Tax=Paraburkholderia silvatlantica TaxID=321895 RepID=A0A2U0ZPE4_9BURK|nr:putative transposase [Paraburkholderia silvatlantica]PVY20771.1 integrase-like protein [Paraburkholderia silvatlantica]PXW25211.1 integrase-like protein [Paraburkholderia silvatlantica]PYE14511.1 integrase-like protein [Paraburkholderia silvatlantica]TDR04137.1 integrase-like protein [Paraburkholderia silvatlantica]
MSRKGSCWDNAPTESFFNSLKNERVHGARYRTHREAVSDLFEYIEVFYNRSRRHSSLGFRSPTQFMNLTGTINPHRRVHFIYSTRVVMLP